MFRRLRDFYPIFLSGQSLRNPYRGNARRVTTGQYGTWHSLRRSNSFAVIWMPRTLGFRRTLTPMQGYPPPLPLSINGRLNAGKLSCDYPSAESNSARNFAARFAWPETFSPRCSQYFKPLIVGRFRVRVLSKDALSFLTNALMKTITRHRFKLRFQ